VHIIWQWHASHTAMHVHTKNSYKRDSRFGQGCFFHHPVPLPLKRLSNQIRFWAIFGSCLGPSVSVREHIVNDRQTYREAKT
jgi:hypothetical protein